MERFKNEIKKVLKSGGQLVKGFFFIAIIACFTTCLSGCGGSKKAGSSNEFVVDNQLASPQKGEQIAVLTVRNYGEIKMRLFEQAAPETVKHFVELAKAGKYNDLTFDEIVSDLKIQCSGDCNDEIEAKKSIKESNASLHNYNGAVGAVRIEGDDGNEIGQSGQFYIIYSEAGKRDDFDYVQKNRDAYAEGKIDENEPDYEFSEDVRNNYRQFGGYPVFDMQKRNIFAQIYSGMDVVDKIANCPKVVDSMFDDNSRPAEPIKIEKVEIKIFDGKI